MLRVAVPLPSMNASQSGASPAVPARRPPTPSNDERHDARRCFDRCRQRRCRPLSPTEPSEYLVVEGEVVFVTVPAAGLPPSVRVSVAGLEAPARLPVQVSPDLVDRVESAAVERLAPVDQ